MSAPTPTPQAAQRLDFAEVYTNGYPVTLRRAQQQLGTLAAQDTGLAEVVAQEAWVRVWQHWPDELECRHARAVYAWALRAASRIAIDTQRRVATLARLGQVAMTEHVWDTTLRHWADHALEHQPEAQAAWRELVADLRMVARHWDTTRQQPQTRGRDAALFEAMLADEAQSVTMARLGLEESVVKMSAWRLRARLREALIARERDDQEATG